MDRRRVPVLEIGGTHVTAALVDAVDWTVVPESTTRSALDGSASVDELIAALIDAGRSLGPVDPVWGVAIPGPFDYARGVGEFHGVNKLDALRGVDVGDRLRRALTDGTGRVAFVNDAVAFTVGEWTAGAALGQARAIGVTLGTGVGSAFLVDGVAQVRGPGVPPEGRLDLLEIGGRPLEDTVSRRAIRARYAERTGRGAVETLDVHEITTRAGAGDGQAILVMADAMDALGRALAPRAVDFGATVIVVGGSIALAWELIEQHVQHGMSRSSPRWRDHMGLSRANRLTESALLGAARHALRADV